MTVGKVAQRAHPDAGPTTREVVLLVLVVLVTAVVYVQVYRYDFIELDDTVYVTENPLVREGLTARGVRWAMTSVHGSNWHPLATLSHMLDCDLFGLDPSGHHLVNLLLHLANTVLLYVVLRSSCGGYRAPLFVAALFALHPLHVESVAWVSERKDLLAGLFWIVAIGFHVRFARTRRWGWYGGTLLSFVMGLLSKPMVVTLPFVLLLWDVWPLRRIRKEVSGRTVAVAILEKLPLFLLAVAASVATYLAQSGSGAVAGLRQVPMSLRLANAVEAYARYLISAVWPAKLSVIYPYDTELRLLPVLATALALLAVTVVVVATARRRPYLFTGWFWYLGTLVPVIGLVQVGSQARADRYTYLPLIGVFVLVAWGAAELGSVRPRIRAALSVVGPLLVLLLAGTTWIQVGHWKNSVSLFGHALRIDEENVQARVVLGTALAKAGDLDSAIEQFERVLQRAPDNAEAHYQLGLALSQRGRVEEGIRHLERSLRLDANQTGAIDNLGYAYGLLGRYDEALPLYRELVRRKPEDPLARRNLAIVLFRLGEVAEAVEETRRAHSLARRQGRTDLTGPLAEQLRKYSAALPGARRVGDPP